MEFYQRFGDALSSEDVDAIFAEMETATAKRSSRPMLYRLTRLKVLAQTRGVSENQSGEISLRIERIIKNKKVEKSHLLPLIKTPLEVRN